jgi:two-component system, LytTR family, sensor kinase
MIKIFKSLYNAKKEFLLFGAVTLPALLFFNWLLFGNRYFEDGKLFVASTLFLGIMSLGLNNALQNCNSFVQKRFPLYDDSISRIVLSFISYVILTSVVILFCVWIYQIIPLFNYTFSKNLVINLLIIGFVANLICAFAYEGFYMFKKIKETFIENEKLKKYQLQQQFDNLKSQVNPHFLFNTLSSLSTLIEEDAEKADIFLNEMSKVYRYKLRSNQEGWVTLEQELNFIESYFHLLKIRYGSKINLFKVIDDKYSDWQLPPLTLQMLMDNAIKHNVATKEQPLDIFIETNNNETVTVKNNLQRKNMTIQNSKNELQGLKVKYELIDIVGFNVRETSEKFMVIIPLKKYITKK